MSTNTDLSLNQINISESSSFYQGKCNLKCDYAFSYKLSSCSVTNSGANLFFSYDMNPNGNPQASYNGIEYNVFLIVISAPSFHLFNGKKAPAELTISHIPNVTGPSLVVSIPIITITDMLSSLLTPGSHLVNDMIGQSIELVPKENESATLNLQSYSLEFIIPKTQYFTYSQNKDNIQWVVYGINNAIQIKDDIAKQLAKILPRGDIDNFMSVPNNQKNFALFMSQNPPLDLKLSNSSDEIYIDCQPTGSSTEETKVTYISSSNNQNPTKFFIYVIFFLVVLLIIYMIFSYIMHPNKESISFTSIKKQFM